VFATSFAPDLDACIALYYRTEEPAHQLQQAERFYQGVVAWCNRIRRPPTHLSFDWGGSEGKLGPFGKGNERLCRLGFRDLENFALAVCPRGARSILDADIDCGWFSDNATVVVRSTITNFTDPRFLECLGMSIATLRPEYGIGYYRLRRLGSNLYATGGRLDMGGPPEESEEELHLLREWADQGLEPAIWRRGILRDIYPWNILTPLQIDSAIGKTTVREWILQDSSRGSLRELANDVWLWEVPQSSAERVRDTLDRAGLLFHPNPSNTEE
jgi:hypothetical protein